MSGWTNIKVEYKSGDGTFIPLVVVGFVMSLWMILNGLVLGDIFYVVWGIILSISMLFVLMHYLFFER